MKRLLRLGMLLILVAVAVQNPHSVVFAASQWITTDKVWDDGRVQPNETYKWSGGHDNDGYASGPGVLQWYVAGNLDNRYEGNMSRGKINGKGTCAFSSGNRYEGDWVDGRRTGKGVFTWMNGDRYEGDFANDQRTGKGVLTYANGNRYEGDWVDGRRNGKGVFIWKNGDRYEGEWANDQQNGQGVKTFADGRRWEGIWVNEMQSMGGGETKNFVLLFLTIAAIASWVIRLALKNGRLSWRSVLISTGLYTAIAFTVAAMSGRDSDFVSDFIFSWNIKGFGLDNTLVIFFAIGLIAAFATGLSAKGGFSSARSLGCLLLYALYVLLLFVVWGICVFAAAIFILRIMH